MDTSFFSEINWLATLLGGLGYFMLGALWYSKLLFANSWIGYTKIDMNDPNAKKGVGAIMFSSLLLMMLTAFGISVLKERLGLSGWMSGIKLGALTGACFGATAISISYLYEKRPFGLHCINGLYTFFGNIIAAVIICSWD